MTEPVQVANLRDYVRGLCSLDQMPAGRSRRAVVRGKQYIHSGQGAGELAFLLDPDIAGKQGRVISALHQQDATGGVGISLASFAPNNPIVAPVTGRGANRTVRRVLRVHSSASGARRLQPFG